MQQHQKLLHLRPGSSMRRRPELLRLRNRFRLQQYLQRTMLLLSFLLLRLFFRPSPPFSLLSLLFFSQRNLWPLAQLPLFQQPGFLLLQALLPSLYLQQLLPYLLSMTQRRLRLRRPQQRLRLQRKQQYLRLRLWLWRPLPLQQ